MTDDHQIDDFDRHLGSLEGLPDTVQTRPATIRTTTPLVGSSQTFIIQTVRQTERGDTVFLEYVDRKGSTRIVLPPAVTNAIARQRDALTDKSRSGIVEALTELPRGKGWRVRDLITNAVFERVQREPHTRTDAAALARDLDTLKSLVERRGADWVRKWTLTIDGAAAGQVGRTPDPRD